MKSIMLKGTLSLVLAFGFTTSFAQCNTISLPASAATKAKAEENKLLYENALRSGHVTQARAPLNWLLANAPQLSILIDAEEVFGKLASEEKDSARKKVYLDSLMIIYDLQIKNCGDEASVLNRQALFLSKNHIHDSLARELALFDKVFELNGNNVLDGTLVAYMQTVRSNSLKFKNLSDAQILKRYDLVMRIADAKISKTQREGKPVDHYRKIKDDVDAILFSMVTIDCGFVKKNLEPRFKQNPADVTLARKIFSFMIQLRCTNDPLWLEAGETIYKNSATNDFGLAKNLGLTYYSKERFDKAEPYLKDAVSLAPAGREKAALLVYLGQIHSKTDKAAALVFFRQALELDHGNTEAYEKIGDLYYASYEGCAKKINAVNDRLVFLIAADYYQRAGNGKKLAIARAEFPSKEEITLNEYKTGDIKPVGCWIDESTTIRTRD